jgi:hypothetical protein
MKSYLKVLGIFLFGLLVVLASCNKDDDNNTPPPKTAQEYLTAGFWKTTAMTIDPGINLGGTVITNFFAQVPDCTKDDLVRFNTNGTITDDEGPTKCDPNDPQTVNEGTWVLSADSKTLTISYPGDDPRSFEILELNNTTFKGKYTFVADFGSGILSYAVTVTMALQ